MVLVILGIIGILIIAGTSIDAYHLEDLQSKVELCCDIEEKQGFTNQEQAKPREDEKF